MPFLKYLVNGGRCRSLCPENVYAPSLEIPATRSAGLAAERGRGMRGFNGGKSILTAYCMIS